MQTKKYYEDQIKIWEGVNLYIVKEARNKLKELNYVPDPAPQPVVFKPNNIFEKKPVMKKLVRSEKELLALSKNQQIELLKVLGAKVFPSKEKDRVALIIQLQ